LYRAYHHLGLKVCGIEHDGVLLSSAVARARWTLLHTKAFLDLVSKYPHRLLCQGFRRALALVSDWCLLICPKELDCWKSLHLILAREVLVLVTIHLLWLVGQRAIDGTQAAGTNGVNGMKQWPSELHEGSMWYRGRMWGLQHLPNLDWWANGLGELLPVWKQRLAVSAPRGIEENGPNVVAVDYLHARRHSHQLLHTRARAGRAWNETHGEPFLWSLYPWALRSWSSRQEWQPVQAHKEAEPLTTLAPFYGARQGLPDVGALLSQKSSYLRHSLLKRF